MDIYWKEHRKKAERKCVRLFRKANVTGYKDYLLKNFVEWACKGGNVDEIWCNFKTILSDAIERFVPKKLLSRNPDPEYYNYAVKKLKKKARRLYHQRHKGTQFMEKHKATNMGY